MDRLHHPNAPVYDSRSKVLILGSFPSPKSREGRFFYHHPQNRFWKVISAVCNAEEPSDIESKKALLLNNNLALWDVIESCEVDGASDSSIKEVQVNDFSRIFDTAKIKKVFVNGNTAYNLYKKYCGALYPVQYEKLPSTSSANASYSLERLIGEWSKILLG